ncbi:hypothetical protein P879_10697 [Paragonimus westermani]|uniref:Piwi domain-containing protein n=1 Tax=Paragonimus westermani TaxID=34504 RepID=A0A8T0DAA2_9TREM|nr:hypothetical protein P879_10697 [Paragonimus westermani]
MTRWSKLTPVSSYVCTFFVHLENLLLKINGKLGGTNWILPELTHNHPGDRFMVFGADVTNPSLTQAQELRKSVAAMTGSVSLDLMRYAGVVRQQATTRSADRVIREIIDQMESMMEELLKNYFNPGYSESPARCAHQSLPIRSIPAPVLGVTVWF